MSKKNKNKKYRRISKHHIICRSRGGDSSLENIAKVDTKGHQHYHCLFENKMPFEIVEYLVTKYWKGDWSHVKKAQMTYNRH